MAKRELIDADLWRAIELWLPPERTDVRGGPTRISHRAALAGILFVLRHGLRWRDLPQELGYGSGVTCWRRLRQWQARGVWAGLHRTLLNWLGDLGRIDWTRAYPRLHPAQQQPLQPSRAGPFNPRTASAMLV